MHLLVHEASGEEPLPDRAALIRSGFKEQGTLLVWACWRWPGSGLVGYKKTCCRPPLILTWLDPFLGYLHLLIVAWQVLLLRTCCLQHRWTLTDPAGCGLGLVACQPGPDPEGAEEGGEEGDLDFRPSNSFWGDDPIPGHLWKAGEALDGSAPRLNSAKALFTISWWPQN